MTGRELQLLGVVALIKADPWFPTPGLDMPEPKAWRADCGGSAPGLSDACAVQDGPPPEVTRDGGSEDDYELNAEILIAYAVMGADQAARRARRDEAAARLAEMIRANRTLGTNDVQVYAEIAPAHRDDNVPLPAAAPVAMLHFNLSVDYVAASPAE